jgi:hypothetical protein
MHDVFVLLSWLAKHAEIQRYVLSYSCNQDCTCVCEPCWEIAFWSTEATRGEMHAAIWRFVRLMEREEDGHRMTGSLETLNFSHCFDPECLYYEEDHVERVLRQLDANTFPLPKKLVNS